MTKTLHLERLWGAWLHGALTWISLTGCAMLAAGLLIGFEEMPPGAWIAPFLTMVSTPAAVLGHLLLDAELSAPEKKTWLRELLGPRFPWAIAAYIRCSRRGALARRLARRRRPSAEA